jgi:1-acyl-sn-glycerol-3-phosphate acyltransferase
MFARLRPRLARAGLHLFGWKAIGKRPDLPRMVITAYPHTSNWDLLVYLMVAWELGVPLSWMGKDALFRGPVGVVMRRLGGIGIRRDRRENVVEQMEKNFAAADELCLLIAAEGTRARTEYWKSGFYHIALAANVPISPAFIDYERKEAGFERLVHLTGDPKADMDELRDRYAGRVGRYPELQSPIRLREESV